MSKKKESTSAATTAPATTETAVAKSGPSEKMLALFAGSAERMAKAKVTRRTLPKMLLPKDFPVGAALAGKIHDIVNSPASTVKGKCLWLILADGTEILFPCTGVIRSALAPGVSADDEKLVATLKKEIGKTLFVKRTENVTNKKYGKDQFMFDVYTAEE